MVSDEVWARLDPNAGRLSRRTSRRLMVGAAAGLVVGALVAVLVLAGVLVPRLSYEGNSTISWGTVSGQFTYDFGLRNEGWTDLTVVGVGRDGPGLRLLEARGRFPVTVEPGHNLGVRLEYAVTDCSGVSSEPWPLPVRVRRSWGEQTVYVDIPTAAFRNDEVKAEWQWAIANQVCHAPS